MNDLNQVGEIAGDSPICWLEPVKAHYFSPGLSSHDFINKYIR